MDEKKVREAIYCMKASIGETMCEECVNYYKCDHTKMDDMMRIAIEALEKQLPKKPVVINNTLYNNYRCPRCGDYIVLGEPFCLRCEQQIDWSR